MTFYGVWFPFLFNNCIDLVLVYWACRKFRFGFHSVFDFPLFLLASYCFLHYTSVGKEGFGSLCVDGIAIIISI